jgi:hypothetical protein
LVAAVIALIVEALIVVAVALIVKTRIRIIVETLIGTVVETWIGIIVEAGIVVGIVRMERGMKVCVVCELTLTSDVWIIISHDSNNFSSRVN